MSRTALDDAMAALSAAVLQDSEHPAPDELLAYQAGELAEDAHTRLQEHLAWCSECAQTVVDLASWPEIELRDPALERTAAEEAEDWQAIRRRIAGDATSDCDPAPALAPVPFTVPRPADPMPSVASRSFGLIHLLAAVLLLAVVGLSFQVVKLTRWAPLAQTAIAEAPQANVFVVDLEPVGTAGATRTPEASRSPETAVPTGVKSVVFLLVQTDLRPFADHAVELRGADRKVFWQTGGLVSLPEGGFSIAVPLAAVPSNEIEIRLYGVNGKDRERLSTYRTRIRRNAVP